MCRHRSRPPHGSRRALPHSFPLTTTVSDHIHRPRPPTTLDEDSRSAGPRRRINAAITGRQPRPQPEDDRRLPTSQTQSGECWPPQVREPYVSWTVSTTSGPTSTRTARRWVRRCAIPKYKLDGGLISASVRASLDATMHNRLVGPSKDNDLSSPQAANQLARLKSSR